MCECNKVRCERQQIQRARVGIECGRQAHEGGDERPGAESARAERCDLRAGTGVDASSVGEGEIGLQGVGYGDDGYLGWHEWLSFGGTGKGGDQEEPLWEEAIGEWQGKRHGGSASYATEADRPRYVS